jgi:hypothetical protein
MTMSAPRRIELPDFTRVLWASARARDVWEPRIARITAAWDQIERWSVVDDARPSALQSLAPEGLPTLVHWAAAHRLIVLPLDRVGAGVTYSASSSAVVAGQPWTYRLAVTKPNLAGAWSRAWVDRDDDAIGTLLGFPRCCREFFARTWGQGSVDPTGAMGGVIDGVARGTAPQNILLRWLGVRLVSHLPCAFTCAASASMAGEMMRVGRAHGFEAEIDWIAEMLAWPIAWSALHGIAEIATPILKIATRTDYTPAPHVIRWPGSQYPEDGVSGNAFPYQRPADVKPITLHRSFTAAFTPATTWTDNGFPTATAMADAHAMLVEALDAHPPTGLVADLGCGNGTLLTRIQARFECAAVGVESDAARAARAIAGATVRLGDIRALETLVPEAVDVALVSERRLEEGCGPALMDWAKTHAARLLIYSYDDPRSVRWVTP